MVIAVTHSFSPVADHSHHPLGYSFQEQEQEQQAQLEVVPHRRVRVLGLRRLELVVLGLVLVQEVPRSQRHHRQDHCTWDWAARSHQGEAALALERTQLEQGQVRSSGQAEAAHSHNCYCPTDQAVS